MTAVERAHVASRADWEAAWLDDYDTEKAQSDFELYSQTCDYVGDIDDEPEPVRTETACNAVRCACLAWVDGAVIAGELSCRVCTHTWASHQPRKTGTKVRR